MRQRLLVAVLLLAAAGLAVYAVVSVSGLAKSSKSTPLEELLSANALKLDAGTRVPGPTSISLGMGVALGDNVTAHDAPQLRAAKVGVLRFGNTNADDYDWRGGCIYQVGTRHDCYGAAGNGGELDRFLALAGAVGAQPLIVVNGEIDDPQQAAGEVAYYWQHCVHPPGRQCPDPYWEIGDSPANWHHFAVPLVQRQQSDAQMATPDQYAAVVISYAAAMSRAVPYYSAQSHHIKIVANDWITGATDESWISAVIDGGIDTHYAPLLASSGQPPTVKQVVRAVEQGSDRRPNLHDWLQELRESIQQFGQSSSLPILIGRWSIDANTGPAPEPPVYGSYAQALFAAQMFAHIWQDSQPGGPNPVILAVQAPIAGPAQEPFDITGVTPRAAVAAYTLVGSYFGANAAPVTLGEGAHKAGLVAAGSVVGPHDARILVINTDEAHAHAVDLQGVTAGTGEMWWIRPDASQTDGVSAIQHAKVSGMRVIIPPWAIAVVRVRT